ncbi:hypothetical protein TK45_00235 [Bowmanella sp. JS7-9]|nr:hypothetical protein TK45_00235 [Bowmanella sp. JS7-9]
MLGNQPSLSRYLLPVIQRFVPSFLPDVFRARLLSHQWQCTDMLELTLQVSRRWPGFIAGQHIHLTLNHNGRLITRPFSICSATNEWQSMRRIRLCCRVDPRGEFTSLLGTLNIGDIVNISAAQGDFYWQQPTKPTVFIAAGSGITPIAAMLLSQRHWLAPVTLYYRARGIESAALLQPLTRLAERNPLFNLVFSDSREQTAALFSEQFRHHCSDNHTQYYLCGPAGFMQSITAQLVQNAVQAEHIFREQFGVDIAPATPNAAAETVFNSTLISAGTAHNISVSTSQSILQSAEQQGLTPSFGCRMGVCFQCVCEKVSGQVRDIRNGTLSGHGREQIQLCISQPVSELVIKL